MKSNTIWLRLALFLFGVFFICNETFASAEYIWDGSVNINWNTNGNWDNNPGSQFGDQIYRVNDPASYTNAPRISSTPGFTMNFIVVTEGQLRHSGGTTTVTDDVAIRDGGELRINGGTLNINGNLAIYGSGSTVNVLGGAVLNVAGNIIFGGDSPDYPATTTGSTSLNITSSTVTCGQVDFDDQTGSSHLLSIDGGSLSITNDVRSVGEPVNMSISSSATVTIGGRLNSSNGSLITMNSGDIILSGDWRHRGTTNFTGGTVQFVGTSTQTILNTNNVENFYNLAINNPLGNVSLDDSIIVNNQLDLTDGLIVGNGNSVTFVDDATSINASTTSFVDGPINKIGDDAFEFPTGDGANYNPISISAPASAADVFRAEYFRADATGAGFDVGVRADMVVVSSLEYWTLDRDGSSAVSVTLGFDNNSDVVNLTDLVVARWNSITSRWENEGNGGTTGLPALGTVSSMGPLNNFSPFTLGSTTLATNPLPVELIEFKASALGNIANINWETASEINNNHFILQKTLDGENIIDLAKISSKAEGGNSTEHIKYVYSELIDFEDVAYYRIVQVDHDGTQTVYPFEALRIQPSIQATDFDVSIYPNPVEEGFINVELQDEFDVDFTFISMDGKEHAVRAIKTGNGVYRLEFQGKLDRGIYLLNIFDHQSGAHRITEKVIVQ